MLALLVERAAARHVLFRCRLCVGLDHFWVDAVKRRVRVSPAETRLRQIIALGPAIRASAWDAAQATLAQIKAERAEPHQPRLDALAGKGRA